MKLVTLNLRQGGGKRIDQIIELLISYQGDVLILTEFRNNKNGEMIKSQLLNHGYNYLYSPTSLLINSILIATKSISQQISIKGLNKKDMQRACLIEINGLKIMGVYFAQKNEKRSLFKTLFDNSNDLLNRKSIVIGDFNTGLPYKDETKKSFYCAKEFEQLIDLGFIDAWRTRNPNKYEYSWYSQSENGFRIDHALVSTKFNSLIQSICYDHAPRDQKITDHSALIINLK